MSNANMSTADLRRQLREEEEADADILDHVCRVLLRISRDNHERASRLLSLMPDELIALTAEVPR